MIHPYLCQKNPLIPGSRGLPIKLPQTHIKFINPFPRTSTERLDTNRVLMSDCRASRSSRINKNSFKINIVNKYE